MPEPAAQRPLRLATYNVEWFNDLFDTQDRLVEDDAWSGRYEVTRAAQAAALGTVFNAMDADAVLVVEAPDDSRKRSTTAALEGFAARFGLRTSRALIGFANDTRQELALLYDPAVLRADHVPGTGGAPRFDETFALDLDVDADPDPVTWSKPPLELDITTASGMRFRMIGVHAKSKAPHGAKSPDEVRRVSIENRRKQLAQCIWLRRRVAAHLDAGDSLVVLGDFNDGPGLDEYEKLFGRSGVEIVLGQDGPAERRLYDPHAARALSRHLHAAPTTARFFNVAEKRYLSALLDYVMISPDLRAQARGWRVWHPFDDPQCFADTGLRDALLTASDHFPVTLDLAA